MKKNKERVQEERKITKWKQCERKGKGKGARRNKNGKEKKGKHGNCARGSKLQKKEQKCGKREREKEGV